MRLMLNCATGLLTMKSGFFMSWKTSLESHEPSTDANEILLPSVSLRSTHYVRQIQSEKKTVVHIHKPPTGEQVCIICLKDCLHIVSKRTVETNKCQSVSQSSWPFVSFIVVVKPHLSWIRLNASRQVHLQLSLCMQNGYKIHWRKSSQ